jgi:hypothetical protein
MSVSDLATKTESGADWAGNRSKEVNANRIAALRRYVSFSAQGSRYFTSLPLRGEHARSSAVPSIVVLVVKGVYRRIVHLLAQNAYAQNLRFLYLFDKQPGR